MLEAGVLLSLKRLRLTVAQWLSFKMLLFSAALLVSHSEYYILSSQPRMRPLDGLCTSTVYA